MSLSRKPYKTFTKEFKLEAVRLMSESVPQGQVFNFAQNSRPDPMYSAHEFLAQ
jgi:hypothetical protein